MIKYVLFKTILITLSYLLIKSLSIIYLTINFIINKESEEILNKKFFKIDENRWTNYCIRPKKINTTDEDMPIGTILYKIYYNKVFNLTYIKILLGREKFWIKIIKNIKLKNIIEKIFYLLVGLSKFFITILSIITKYKNKSIQEYLFSTFCNPWDEISDRLIIRINNKWEINGIRKRIHQKIKEELYYKTSENKWSSGSIEIWKMIEKWEKEYSKYSYETITKSILHKNKSIGIHNIFPELIKENKLVAYMTDLNKAEKKNNFSLSPFIYKFEGDKKDSRILIDDIYNVKQLEEEKSISSLKIILGAKVNGFNETFASKKFLNNIESIEEIWLMIDTDLENLGLNNEKAIKIRNEFMSEYGNFLSLNLNHKLRDSIDN